MDFQRNGLQSNDRKVHLIKHLVVLPTFSLYMEVYFSSSKVQQQTSSYNTFFSKLDSNTEIISLIKFLQVTGPLRVSAIQNQMLFEQKVKFKHAAFLKQNGGGLFFFEFNCSCYSSQNCAS